MGWWGWWDQGQYWKTAGELAAGHLGQSQYWWGYPLIGALFYKVVPAHPFFFANYFLGFIVVLFFYLMTVRFVTRLEALVLLVVLILASHEMMFQSLIVPWNTIVTYAAVFSISYLLVISRASRRAVFFCVALVGLSTLVRPQDTPLLVAYLVSICYFRFDFPTFARMAGLTIAVVSIGAAILALLNLMAFGQVKPPYVDAANAVGLSLDGMGFRLYQLYIDGALLHGHSALPPGRTPPSLLLKLPLMVFSFAGAWLLWRRIGHRALPLIGVCFVAIFFYTSFNATGNPPHFWSFHLYHYFWWTGVILSMLGYSFLRQWALRHEIPRTAKGIALVTVVGLALIGFGEEATTYFNHSEQSQSTSVDIQQIGDKAQFTFGFQGNDESGLRLAFRNALPFHLTSPGGDKIVSVEINGEKWHYWKDFMVSQEANTVNIHLYRSPPSGHVKAVVTLAGLVNPDLASAQWLRIQFQPFATLHRLTNWLFGAEWAVGSSPYLVRPYRVGEKLQFGASAGNNTYLNLISGWSIQEAEFVWSVKKIAQIQLGVIPGEFVGKGCAVEIDFTTFGANTLLLKMNGKPVGTPVSSSGQRQTVRFSPCPEVQSSSITLGLEVGRLRSPASIGMNNDLRQLGVALFSLRLIKEQ